MRVLVLLAVFGALSGCGEEESILVLNVDISSYSIPSELNLIRVETTDAEDSTRLIGRNFPQDSPAQEVEIILVLGTRLPRAQILTIQGFRGTTLVGTSDPTPVLFEKGEIVKVRVGL